MTTGNGNRPPLEPLRPAYRIQYFSDEELDKLQEATLNILEHIGVKFMTDKALDVLSSHGASVDKQTGIVKMKPDLVFKAMKTVPRFFTMASRIPEYDLHLAEGVTYFTTDGCGVEVVELGTDTPRTSTKADVAMMARIADYLPSIGFYWPMVSAQDFGRASPLHELDAGWNNTVKHFQSETIMGEVEAKYAVEMATVVTGSRENLRKRPILSSLICTISPLMQDKPGLDAALVFAEAGIPVIFLSMPTMGTTAPVTQAGALAMADAENISATVLLQLMFPGCPVGHSIMQAWADMRTGGYVSYPRDARGRYGVVDMAHHWGLPSLGACYGTDSKITGTWQQAAETALDPFLAGLASPEIVTGMGLSRTYTRLYPEQIILDDDVYQRARAYLQKMEVDDHSLALEAIRNVGPGGHFLGQKHTREHMRTSLVRGVTHNLDAQNKYRNPIEVAREKAKWILENHQPTPLEPAEQAEIDRILAAAEKELALVYA
ncbi:MAG TPA: trimethylamine methyltransferase family protein [Anaerolineales bacterium]|nr:trimethylamine methyltransferase family protein [Anaerolineales bacterium]HNB34822.1 trimethylamine methyltransferase family protein [Anaerolineales bacterium]